MAFSQLTDLCAQAVSEGWLGVYQLRWEQLNREQHSWTQPAPVDHTSGGGDQQMKVGQKEGEGNGEQGEEEEEWVSKASASSTSVQGPFSRRELLALYGRGAGGADSAAVVRKVGATAWQPISDAIAQMR